MRFSLDWRVNSIYNKEVTRTAVRSYYENFSYLFVIISMWHSHPHKCNSGFYCP